MHGATVKPKKYKVLGRNINLAEELGQAEARVHFWAFRQYMHPYMEKGWWVKEVSCHFQQFYEDMVAGKRPKLILESPPQHGKSFTVEDFLAWIAGVNPNWKSVFTSYADDLGMRTNTTLQRMIMSERYKKVFAKTKLPEENTVALSDRYRRTSRLLEFVGHTGSFRNTTVNGAINGLGLDLGAIDDPIKGRKEANSITIRDSTWSWLTDDFFNRFSDGAGFLMTTTRWHVDDPAGRFVLKFPDTKVLKYAALGKFDEDCKWVADKDGTPLFPEFKSLEHIRERQSLMTQAGFESVFQQSPYVIGGGMFQIEQFDLISPNFDKKLIQSSVRYWDKAGTDKDDGAIAYTAGVLMHKIKNDLYIIEDVRHGQWSALKREQIIKQTAQMDRDSFGYGKVQTWIEQEPGSGGKESAENSVRNLGGFSVFPDKVTGDKITRAEPYAAQVEGNNVMLVQAEWNRNFIDEHETFPAGKTKDIVDASAGAFMKLNTGSTYDLRRFIVG
jgi:predicted phage terminase large subunit-like protein